MRNPGAPATLTHVEGQAHVKVGGPTGFCWRGGVPNSDPGLARDEVVVRGKGVGVLFYSLPGQGPQSAPKPLKEAVCIHREAPKGA